MSYYESVKDPVLDKIISFTGTKKAGEERFRQMRQYLLSEYRLNLSMYFDAMEIEFSTDLIKLFLEENQDSRQAINDTMADVHAQSRHRKLGLTY